MYGGSISGNTVPGSGSAGGGVYVGSGTFTMSGGSISGNNANLGGGVYAAGTFTMNGGSISSNEATYGGGVYMNTSTSFYMYGGSITNNEATSGAGGVRVSSNCNMTVRGDVNITGNTKDSNASNVYLTENQYITIDSGGLTGKAKVGVTTYKEPETSNPIEIAIGASGLSPYTVIEKDMNALYPDAGEDNYHLELDNNEIKMFAGAKPHKHCVCGESNCNKEEHNKGQTWTGVSTLSEITKEGYYYLTDNVELSGSWKPADGVVLCLNGKTITGSNDTSAIVVNSSVTFTLTDCAAGKTGKVTHAKNNAGRGVYVYDGGTFNMYGGNITGNNINNGLGGGVYGGGTFNMYGGSIAKNSVTGSDGGGVYVGGSFTVSNDVKIKDNFKGSNPNNVYLPKDKTITIDTGGLTAGAEIGVTTETLPPVKIATVNNENYKNYFVSDATNYYTVFDDGGIYLSTTEELHKHFLCGGNTCSKIGHNEENSTTTFKEWSDATKLPSVEGKYYLTKNVTISNTWTPASGMVLCLNGHTITCANNGKVINLNFDGIFTLTDCSEHETGKVTHASDTTGGGVYVDGGRFTMYGGSITGNKAGSDNGGGVHVRMSGSRFNMVGGSITDNTASKGGGVYVESVGQFNMSGGSISKNGATNTDSNCNGGGVYVVRNSSFTMSGGTITDNTATGGSSNNNGGGVYVSNGSTFNMSAGNVFGNSSQFGGGVYVAHSTFNLTGGSICNNNAIKDGDFGDGGGVYVYIDAAGQSNFTVSGNVKITGNKVGVTDTNGTFTADKDSNVYLPKYTTSTTTSTITIGTGGLTAGENGAKIGVTTGDTPTDKNPVKIATGATKDVNYTDIFKSDVTDKGYVITRDGENVYLSAHQHNWTYTASGNTITATCKGCVANDNRDYSGGTLTIKAPDDLTYNGKAKAATVDMTTGNWQGETVDDSKITYKQGEKSLGTTAPTGAGEYTASIKLGDAEAGVTYIIAKATPTVNWQGYSYNKSFTGSAIANPTSSDIQIHDGKNNVLSLWDSVEFKWYKATKAAGGTYTKADDNALEANPIDAGDYIIEAVFAETNNTNAATCVQGLSIGKAEDLGGNDKTVKKTVNVFLTGVERTYTVDVAEVLTEEGIRYGSNLEVNSSMGGINHTNSTLVKSAELNSTTLTITMNSLSQASEGSVGSVIANLTSSNYNVIPMVFSLNAVAKPTKKLNVSMADWIYGNTANSPVYDIPQNTTETTVTYTKKDGAVVTGVPTDAGEYTVTVKCETDTEVYTGTVNFTIEKRTVNISGLTGVDKVYDGTTTASVNCDNVVFENKLDSDGLTFTVNSARFGNANVGDKKTISFGNAYTFGGASAANYRIGTLQNTLYANITKKEITFAYEYIGQKQYDGTVNARVYNPKINGLIGEETLTSGTDYTVSAVFDSADVGDKQVTITVVLKDTDKANNYQWSNKTDQIEINTTKERGILLGNSGVFGSEDGTAVLTLRYTDTNEHRYKIDTSLLPKGQNWKLSSRSSKVHCSIDSNTNELIYKNSTGTAGETFDATITAQCSNYSNWTHKVTIKLTDRDEQTGFAFENNTKSVTKTYGDEDFAVTASGQVDGSTVTYSSKNPDVATVDATTGKVTIKGAGTATISAKASETTDYAEKTVSYTLTVNKKQITVPAADTTVYTYNGTEQTYKLAENAAYTITGNKKTNANETGYTVTVALKDTANTKWAGEGDDTADKTYTFVIKKAAVTITVKDKTAYVGENPPVLGEDYTVSGLVGSDTLDTLPELKYVDADGNETTPDMTKTGDTIIRAIGASAGSNYNISCVDGKLTVSNKPSGGHTKNTDVITTGDKDKTTTSPAEVKTDGAGTATAAVSKANQEEILKQAKDNKSSDIVLDISDKDTKGADNIQLELPKSMIDAIANDTAADLTINTEHGKLTVDKDTLDQLSKDAKGSTLRIIITKIKEPTAEQQKLAGDNVQPYRLTIMSGNQTIGSFAGKITVRLPIPEILKDKTVAAVYFDSDGKLTEMPGKRMMIDGIEYYVFETTHFSEFGLVDAVEAGLVKTDDSKDKVKEAKSIVSKMNLTAVTSKTTKKNVKVTVTMNKKTSSDIKALKELGYTVKYRFYRSTKKSAGYKSKITKKTNTYINTAGKKGTRYYYKAQVRVYDSKGKLITTTALKQCSYGTRTWSK